VTVRDVAGDGAQAELWIQTRCGSMSIRLLAEAPIRLIDLRKRDKAKRKRVRRADIPIEVPR
jgi:hypothetical protein